ncbi:MAG: UDP-4-amino-4,6-dideoxy-N-acetyl-beta-L-altrosamine transaminase [Candidatus Magasanikbacteria bacterium]
MSKSEKKYFENFLPYGQHYINEEDIKNVTEVLKSSWITQGDRVDEFEEKFSDYVGAKYAVAVSSGTTALHLSCLAAGAGSGDEVITSPMSFAASSNCALYCGARSVFSDVNNKGLIYKKQIEKKITDRTKAIIPVHYTGLPCNMEPIKGLADKYNLKIIEDACHALGAEYNGSKIGSCRYSDMSVFSFHPVKHITTGEGGIITTNSKDTYQYLKKLRAHGQEKEKKNFENESHGPWYYEIQDLGYNYRITDIQCAIGISQLDKVNDFVNKRQKLAHQYDKLIKNIDNVSSLYSFTKNSSYHLYVVTLDSERLMSSKKEIFKELRDRNVGVHVHYVPIYKHPYYQENFDFNEDEYPKTEELYDRILTLPMFPQMSIEDCENVVEILSSVVEEI